MGIHINSMSSAFGDFSSTDVDLQHRTVAGLASYCLKHVVFKPMKFSHLLTVTSCPDSIAPSLGQNLNQLFHPLLEKLHTIDMVQGCAGGVSALILASQLAEANRSNVLLVTSDAARKATSPSSPVYDVFKNGVFSCCVSYVRGRSGMIHYQSRQFKDLYEVVKIGLGHDADEIISNNLHDISPDSRKYLGLLLDNTSALKLMKEAEKFYLDFVQKTGHPDILILHQVNKPIIDHLEQVFSKYPVRFINMATDVGNCGCATTGIVLDNIKSEIHGKKVMICSFGTGGVITAGLWQF